MPLEENIKLVTKEYVDNSIKQNNCKLAEAIISTARTSTNELIVTDVSSLCKTGEIGVYSSTGELEQGTKEIIPTGDPVNITDPILGFSQSIDPVTNISLVKTDDTLYGSLGVLFSNDTYLYTDGSALDYPSTYRLLYFIDGDILTYSYEVYQEGAYVVKKSATVSGYRNLKIVAVYSNFESAIIPKLYNCVEKTTPLPDTTIMVSDGTTTQQYTTDTEGLVKNAQIYSPKTIISLSDRDLKTIISLIYNQNIQDYIDNGLQYKKNIVSVTNKSVYGADSSGDVMIPISSSGEGNTIPEYDIRGVLYSKDPSTVYEESHKNQVVNLRYFENNRTKIANKDLSVDTEVEGSTYRVGVRISAESNNQLSLVEDGLYVKPSTSKIAYTVKLTEQPSSEEKKTYTADASYEMIKAAYDAGDIIKVRIVQDGDNSELPLMNASFNGTNAGFTFGYTQITTGGQLLSTRAINYLHTSTIDKWEDADDSTDLSIYISTAGGTINGNLDVTGQVKAQTVHVDGEAPIYLGSTNVADEKGARITGIVNENAAAVVVPNTQNTYANVYVAEPINNSHSATKKYVDDIKTELYGTAQDTLASNTIQGNKNAITSANAEIAKKIEGTDIPANNIFATDNDNGVTGLPYSTTATASNIVKRNDTGNITLPADQTTAEDTDAASISYVKNLNNTKQDKITSSSTVILDMLKANTIEGQNGDLELNADTHINDGKSLYATSIDMQYAGVNKGIIQGVADLTSTSTEDTVPNKKYIDNSISDIKAKTKIDRLQYSDASILDINDVNSAKINCNIITQASTNQIYVYGKNIIDNSRYITPKTISGVTITYLPDEDAYLFDGTVTSTSGTTFQLSSSLPIYVNGANYVGYCQKLSGSISNTDIYCTLQFRVADTAPTGPVVGNAKGTVQVGKGAIGEEVRSTSTNIIQNNYIYDIGLYTQAGQTFNSLKVKLMLSLQKPSNFPYVTYSAPIVYPIENNISYINIPESGALVGLNTVGTISGTADKLLINDVVYKDYQGISAMCISASKEYVDGLVGNINSVLATLVDVNTNTIQSDEPPESEENTLSESTVEGGLS